MQRSWTGYERQCGTSELQQAGVPAGPACAAGATCWPRPSATRHRSELTHVGKEPTMPAHEPHCNRVQECVQQSRAPSTTSTTLALLPVLYMCGCGTVMSLLPRQPRHCAQVNPTGTLCHTSLPLPLPLALPRPLHPAPTQTGCLRTRVQNTLLPHQSLPTSAPAAVRSTTVNGSLSYAAQHVLTATIRSWGSLGSQ